MKLEDDLCPHYLNLDFSANFFNDDTKVNFQLPYPISKPMKYSEIDIIKEFNDKLEDYDTELGLLSKDFHLVKNRIKTETFNKTHATITKGLLHLCNVDKKEAPFPCDYNPYFATGRLEHISFGSDDYLVTTDYRNNLYAIDVSDPLKRTKIKSDQSPRIITGMSSCKTNGITFLLLKHSTDLSLHKLQNIDENTQVVFTKKFKTDVLDAKVKETKVGVVLTDQKLRLYDVETKQKSCIDQVVHFEFIDSNSVAVLSKKLRIIDLRSENENVLELDLNPCDYLCSLKTSGDVLYLATRHHLVRTDTRFLKNVEFCGHLMKSSPCFMDLAGNFLCLSSQNAREKVVFTGDPIGSLPIQIPSVLDTLAKCRLKKDLLLRNDVGDRLQKTVGGVKLLGDGNGVTLYTANSLGDVFKQKLHGLSDDTPIEALYIWLSSLPKSTRPLHLTNVMNTSEIKFSFNKRLEQKHLLKFTRKPRKIGYFLNHFKNRYQKDNMGELAANFLSIWEEEEEEREDVVVPEVAPLDKVSDWIDSQYFF